jgi:hypothetical protein
VQVNVLALGREVREVFEILVWRDAFEFVFPRRDLLQNDKTKVPAGASILRLLLRVQL